MSSVDRTEFRQYLVVSNIKGGDVRQRFLYTAADEKRLGWRAPGVDAKLRAVAQMAWLRGQGADLKGARVTMIFNRLTPEAWEDVKQWWWMSNKSCVWVDLPSRGRPSSESNIDAMQMSELRSEAFARGGMTAYNDVIIDW